MKFVRRNNVGKKIVAGCVLFASLCSAGVVTPTQKVFAAAGVPEILNHQGRLLDSSGNLLGGAGTDYCFRFSLYDGVSGGTKLWPAGTPSTMTVAVTNGVFSVGIGDVASGGDALTYNFADHDTTYLNIDVAGQSGGSCSGVSFETLSPRQRIFSSGYALNANTVGGFVPAQSATGDQIPVLTDGNLNFGDAAAEINGNGTNPLTLQGTGTGDLRFFSSLNTLTSSGALTLAGSVTASGLTVSAGTVSLPAGQIDNTELANSSVTVTAGTGLSGGGAVSLGGSVSLAAVLGSTIDTSEIDDNTVGTADLTGTLAFADGDFLDLSSINASGTSEGLKLPQATNVSAATAEGQISWDTDGDTLYIGTGSGVVAISNPFSATIDSSEITDGTITGTDVQDASIANGDLTNSSVTVTAGTGLSGGGAVALGGSITIDSALGTAIDSSEITDDIVTTTDLAAALSFADGDFLDLSSVNASSTTEGLKLPQSTNVSASTASGQVTWDTDDKILYVGDGSTVIAISNPFGSAIESSEITDGTVANGDLANSSVTVTAGTGLSGGGAVSLGGSVSLSSTLGTAIDTSEITDGTITGTDVQDGSIANGDLTNSSVTVTAGTGLSGGGLVALGGSISISSSLGTSIESGEITDGTVSNTDLANSSLTVTAGNGLTDGGSISLGGSASINIASGNGGIVVGADAITLTAAPSADGLSSTTSSGSGLEVLATGVALLQGCDDTQVLKWNEASDVWACQDDSAGGGTGTLDDVYTNGGTVTLDTSNITFNLSDATNDYAFVLDNTSTGAVAKGIQFLSSGIGATTTTAIDASDADIGTALAVGSNDVTVGGATISSSEFAALDGGIALSELIDSGTLTATSVAIGGGSIDATTIGASTPSTGAFTTLGATGVVTLGNNTNTVAINSNDWDISTSGALTGVSFDANGTGNSITNIEGADIIDGSVANADLENSGITVTAGTGLSGGGAVSLGGSVSLAATLGTAVDSSEITNDTISASDLGATLTFADGDYLDLAAINASSGSEGLRLPQATDVSASTTEGQVTWDTDNDILYVGTGAGVVAVSNPFGSSIDSSEITDGTVTATDITDGTITGTDISDGSVANGDLTNSSITITAGTALSGGGTVALGGSLTLTSDLGSSISSSEISDNTITTTDLAAALTFADGDMLDLSSVNASSTTEGLKLPQATNVASSTANGQVTWDTDDKILYVGDGSTVIAISNPFGSAIDSSEITDGTVTGTDISDGSVANGDLTNSSVTVTAGTGLSGGGAVSLGGSVSLAATLGTAIDTSEITDGTITGTDVQDGSIANGDLTNSGVTVTAGTGLSGGGLVALGGTVSVSSTLGVAIDSSEITDGTVTNTDLANSSLTVTAGNGLTDGGSISLGGSASLNIASANGGIVVNANDIALTVAASADGISVTTSSGSGLEIASTGLALLQGCSDSQILKWNETSDTWGCAADATGGGSSSMDDAYNIGSTVVVDAADVVWQLNDATSDYKMTIDNTTTGDIGTGLSFATSGSGATIGVAIDVSDADIATALALGANDVTVNGVTLSAAELARLDGKNAALVDTNDAVATGIVGTGALNAGSITSGFGAIDIGADTFTTTGDVYANNFDMSTASSMTIAGSNAILVSMCTSTNCDGIEIGTGGDHDVILIGDSTDTIGIDSAEFGVSSTTGSLTINDGGDAGSVTIEGTVLDIDSLDFAGAATITSTGAGNDITLAPTDDIIASIGGSKNVQVTAGSAPTVDMLALTNAGQGTTTDGVDGLSITFVTGDGSNPVNAGLHIALTNGGSATGDTVMGLYLDNITPSSGTEVGTYIGTGYDRDIQFADTTPDIRLADSATLTVEDNATLNNDLLNIGTSTSRGSMNVYGDLKTKGYSDLIALANITDTFIYDTTADVDDGVWTDSDISRGLGWYTEGKDDGTGDECVISSDDRCGTSAFPRKALIISTTTDVYIFDAIANTMWMRFTQTGGTFALGTDSNNNPSSVFAMNGVLYVGTNGSGGTGLYAFDFIQNRMYNYDTTDRAQSDTSIETRNTATSYASNSVAKLQIVNNLVNDVHANTITGTASILTNGGGVNGLTMIAAATDAGISVINVSSGVTIDYADNANDDYNAVWITKRARLYGINETTIAVERWGAIVTGGVGVDVDVADQATPTKTWTTAAAPGRLWPLAVTMNANAPDALEVVERSSYVDDATAGGGDIIYAGHSLGMSEIHDVNAANAAPAWPAVKYYTKDYITSYLPGNAKADFTFNETTLDADITSHAVDSLALSLQPFGSPTTIDGVKNMALHLDNTNDYLCNDSSTNDGTCDVDADWNVGAVSFTLAAWFRHGTTAPAAGGDVLFDRRYTAFAAAEGVGYTLEMNTSGQMIFGIQDTAATAAYDDSVTSTQTFNDGQWHHVAVVNTDTAICMYIDGRLAVACDTALAATLTLDASQLVTVGADASVVGGANYWDGDIDELSFSGGGTTTQDNTPFTLVKKMYLEGRAALAHHALYLVDATTSSSTTVGKSGQTWPVNQFAGEMVEIYGGTGSGQTRRVVSNTATVLTVSPAFTTPPDSTSDFQILPERIYGSAAPVTAIGTYPLMLNDTRDVFVATSNGTDGGGVTQFTGFGDNSGTAYFHSDAGITDDGGTAWSGTDYDDAASLAITDDYFGIGSLAHFYVRSVDQSFMSTIDHFTDALGYLRLEVSHDILGATNYEFGNLGGADLAEYYYANELLEPGDVVAIQPDQPAGISKSSGPYQKNLLGIVSTAPGIILGPSAENSYPIALSGRVPVKITNENGAIHVGDLLTSSTRDGYAMRATSAGAVIGRVLNEPETMVPCGAALPTVEDGISEEGPGVTDGDGQSAPAVVVPETVTTSASSSAGAMCGWAMIFVGLSETQGQSVLTLAHEYASTAAQETAVAMSQTTDGLSNTTASTATIGSSQSIMAFLRSVKAARATDGVDLQNVFTDRIAASTDVLAPLVVADAAQIDVLRGASTENMTIDLGENGTLALSGGSQPVVRFDAQGNAFFAGSITAQSITVADTASAQTVDLTTVNDAIAFLTSGYSTLSTALTTATTTWTDRTTSLEALLSAQSTALTDVTNRVVALEARANGTTDGLSVNGDVAVSGVATFGGTLFVNTLGSIGSLLSMLNDVAFIGTPYFNRDTAGFAVIAAGDTVVHVDFEHEYHYQPIVQAGVSFELPADDVSRTPEESAALLAQLADAEQIYFASNVRYAVTKKDVHGFDIVLSAPLAVDLPLSWTAFAVEDARTLRSVPPAPAVNAMPAQVPVTPSVEVAPVQPPVEMNGGEVIGGDVVVPETSIPIEPETNVLPVESVVQEPVNDGIPSEQPSQESVPAPSAPSAEAVDPGVSGSEGV